MKLPQLTLVMVSKEYKKQEVVVPHLKIEKPLESLKTPIPDPFNKKGINIDIYI